MKRLSSRRGDHCSFATELSGQTADRHTLVATVQRAGDPSGEITAILIAEAALALARQPADAAQCGVLTPGACFGSRLVPSLREAGFTFELRELAGQSHRW